MAALLSNAPLASRGTGRRGSRGENGVVCVFELLHADGLRQRPLLPNLVVDTERAAAAGAAELDHDLPFAREHVENHDGRVDGFCGDFVRGGEGRDAVAVLCDGGVGWDTPSAHASGAMAVNKYGPGGIVAPVLEL